MVPGGGRWSVMGPWKMVWYDHETNDGRTIVMRCGVCTSGLQCYSKACQESCLMTGEICVMIGLVGLLVSQAGLDTGMFPVLLM